MSDILNDLFENIDVQEPSEVNEQPSNETQSTEPVVETSPEVVESNEPVVESAPIKETPKVEQNIDIEKEVNRIIAQRDKEQRDKIEHDAKVKAEEEEKLKNIPDPVLDIDAWKKYQLDREARLQSNFDNKLKIEQEQARNAQILTNLSNTIESTRQSAETTYTKSVVDEAERWAADLIKQNPDYLSYLVNNPSLDYITKEYVKLQDKIAFENDPTEFIMRKYKEISGTNHTEVNQPTKKPPTSINKVSSANTPTPEVPVFLQGLF